MTSPLVDVVIPVHTALRPISRAVASVLDGTRAPVRVTVVCHGIDPAVIGDVLGGMLDEGRVRLLSHVDGIPSPAGPINAGLDAATAPFTALLDSDDTYARGAVDAWVAVQQRDDADVVIPALGYLDGRPTRTPPVRPTRTRRLDGVRDRLAYRTRQHGLVSRDRLGDVRMTPGLRSGEDVIQGLRIWFSGARISFARGLPGYVIHEDQEERTSVVAKPAAESLSFLDAILDGPWAQSLDAAARESIGVKLLRTHVMDILGTALAGSSRRGEDFAALTSATTRISAFAPRAAQILGARDARIVRALIDGSIDAEMLSADLAARTDYRRPSNVVPGSPRHLFNREAPLRFLVGTAFSR